MEEKKDFEEKVDREALEKAKGEQKLDITAELIKLYQNDPVCNRVIQYLLAKYKIIPLNAVESISQHREEILLQIVLTYRNLWNMRGNILKRTMESADKPIITKIKREGDNGTNRPGEEEKKN